MAETTSTTLCVLTHSLSEFRFTENADGTTTVERMGVCETSFSPFVVAARVSEIRVGEPVSGVCIDGMSWHTSRVEHVVELD